jgi:hypothetical protein
MKHMIVLDDSRQHSKLTQLVEAFYPGQTFMTLPLDRYPIAPLGSQDEKLRLDQFQSLAKLLARAEKVSFGSSFIWGEPSGRLKVFLDRFSDEKIIESLGLEQKWFGVSVEALAIGEELTYTESSERVFRRFAKRFGMSYQGLFYHSSAIPFTDNRFTDAKEIFLNSTGQSA